MPVYKVTQFFTADPKAAGQSKERLIEAANKATAIRHVANDTITAETCDVTNAMRLAQAGVKVEKVAE
ncbi:MAG: hypothetical protein H7Z19_08225 [Chitinophagaceae bacterium]|nr:hypothetical protein [Rubrivivax sp.]